MECIVIKDELNFLKKKKKRFRSSDLVEESTLMLSYGALIAFCRVEIC